jgi:hypothetical protein
VPDVRLSPNSGHYCGHCVTSELCHLRSNNNTKSGHTYDVGRIRNSKPYRSNISFEVIERRYAM